MLASIAAVAVLRSTELIIVGKGGERREDNGGRATRMRVIRFVFFFKEYLLSGAVRAVLDEHGPLDAAGYWQSGTKRLMRPDDSDIARRRAPNIREAFKTALKFDETQNYFHLNGA